MGAARLIAEERNNLIEAYREGHQAVIEALEQYPPSMWKDKQAPGSWTIHEIIIHLTDSEVNGFVRLRMILAQAGSTIMAYDQDAWAEQLCYHDQSTDLALALLDRLRRNNLDILTKLPETAWQLSVKHPESGVFTLEDWLAAYSKHVPNHLNQMARVFEAWQAENK